MPAPAKDQSGTNTSTGGTTTTIAVTSAANSVVVVGAVVGSTSTTTIPTLSIAGAGLTWNAAPPGSGIGNVNFRVATQLFWAYTASALTAQTVTITSSLTIDAASTGYETLTGANAVSPVDPNALSAFGSYGASTQGTITTTNANDTTLVLVGSNYNTGPAAAVGTGTRDLNTVASNGLFAYFALGRWPYTSAQTGATVGFTGVGSSGGLSAITLTADAPPPKTTWSNTDKNGVTLSGTNSLTATTTTGAINGVRTIDRQSTGKYYFEYALISVGSTYGVGVASPAAVMSTAINTAVNIAFTYSSTGNIWVNTVNSGATLGARANGDIIGVALDADTKRIWFRVAPSGNWNGSGTANPATNVGGISVVSLSPDNNLSPLYGFYGAVGSSAVATANFGDTAFSGTVPSGFTSGFPVNGTVTWSPSDKNAGIALSNANRAATSSAGSGSVNVAGRATTAISPTIKQYFEVTVGGTVGQYFSVGVMNSAAVLTDNMAEHNGAALVNNLFGAATKVYRNGLQQTTHPTLFSSGQVIRVAIDRAANRIWWAINNIIWNGSSIWIGDGTVVTNPATGIGGLDISAVTGTIYPAWSSAWTGDVATLNAGATAFAYAIPSGFTALDTTGPPLIAADTQIGVEQWGAANPDGQVTQIALEQWVSGFTLPAGTTHVLSASRAGVGSVIVQAIASNTYNVADVGVVQTSIPSGGGGGGGGGTGTRVIVMA